MQLAGNTLALNTSASITVQGDRGSPAFFVLAPIKSAALSSLRVDADNFPQAHAYLRATLVEGRTDAPLTVQGAEELLAIGVFAPRDALPQPVRYRLPVLDPAAAACTQNEAEARSADPLRAQGFSLPQAWQGLPLRFLPHHHGSVWAPVLLEPRVRSSNELGVRSSNVACFDAAGISLENRHATLLDLTPPTAAAAATELDSAATREHFAHAGFATLDELLPAAHVTELGRYFRELAAEGFLGRDDAGGTHRFVAHNHPIVRFWHQQLNARVAQLVGRATKPSYSFVSAYEAGGDLSWHTDRPPCEYTITLLVDYAPLAADGRSPWALEVRGRDGGIAALHQRIGDALIFKGRELRHRRERLPDGHRSTSILFHFVDDEYDGVMA